MNAATTPQLSVNIVVTTAVSSSADEGELIFLLFLCVCVTPSGDPGQPDAEPGVPAVPGHPGEHGAAGREDEVRSFSVLT